MTDFTLTLRDDHDIDALRAAYARDGVVRVERLFPDDVAEAIYQVLLRGTPWRMVHSNAQGGHQYYKPEAWHGMDPAARQALITETLSRAREGFAYLYACYPMIDALLDGDDPDWQLHPLTEFLNSPEFLDFTKAITDEPEVIKIDGQATMYAPGHFLNRHTDAGTEFERRAAYVMGFSKNWRADWGGQLLFLDGDEDTADITRGFTPSFNTLSMFKVPRPHIVTQVTNFAGAGRYSVTGWLRVDEK